MGIRSVEDLLNFVPGMQSTRTASRSAYSVGARGRNSAQLSNDILFLLDGQRLNDDVSGAALLFNRFLATGNVQQIEVIRGPGSALYGSNAFLGIINIVTSRDLNEGFIAGRSKDGLEGSVALSDGDERYHATLFLSGFRDSGEKFTDPTDPSGGTIRDPRRAFSVYATLDAGLLSINARHAQFRADEFYVFRVTPGNAINEYRSEDTSISASYDLLDDDAGKLVLSGGLRRIESEGLGEPFDADTMQFLGLGTEPFHGGPVARLDQWNLKLDGSTQWGERHRLFGGIEYRHTGFDKLANQNNYETVELIDRLIFRRPVDVTFYGDVIETTLFGPQGDSRDIFGAYIQDKIRINDRLTATLGLRYDDYSDFGSSINPRAALVYKYALDTTLKLMYGEAFRAPTISELTTINNPVSLGNPDLDPERIQTLELAWLQELGSSHLTLTGYCSLLRDQIINVPVGEGDPRVTSTNDKSENLSGVEIELGMDITSSLSLRGTFSHAFELVENPRTMPRNTASLIANHHAGPLNTNLNLTYRSSLETRTTQPERLDPSWDVNLNMRYRLGPAILVGSIFNLTNDTTGGFTQTNVPGGTPRRERSFRIGIEHPF